MKLLATIYSQFKSLSWLGLRILQATYCIFCITLLSVILLFIFPEIVSNHVLRNNIIYELLNTSTRLLTLGVITAFASDIIIRI